MTVHVFRAERRRLPGVVVRADLRITSSQEVAQDSGRACIGRHWMGDDVRGPNAMTREKFVQTAERVDVLEGLVPAGARIPLIVAFGVDRDEQGWPARGGHGAHR